MFYISEGGTNMKMNHKVSFRWKQMVLILIAGLFLTGAQPAEAKTKNVSPFKTFKLGALNVKKRVNESLWMCDNAFEASDGVPGGVLFVCRDGQGKKRKPCTVQTEKRI